MEDKDSNVVYFNVKDIEPYKNEKEKAVKHVSGIINKTYVETERLIEGGKVFLFINSETEETWFEVFE